MTNRYIDLIKQTFDFPKNGFEVIDGLLFFHGIPLQKVIDRYGTPLQLTYLPKVSLQINKAQKLFQEAINKHSYQGNYYYCYCTKSSHFSFILEEALKNDIHLELSSNYDLDIIQILLQQEKISKNTFLVCNGYKTLDYIYGITQLINQGHQRVIPVLDNIEEYQYYENNITEVCSIGIRVATEEEPTFEFYTSRLGISYNKIIPFFEERIKHNSSFKLEMLHFFINTGIKDVTYYWNELAKILQLYCRLKKICPSLQYLNIGGGMPIHHTLDKQHDYGYLINEIVKLIKTTCQQEQVAEPHLFTEFGNFTVGESGATIFSVLSEKKQNDREAWYMIDGSLLTTLPDISGLQQPFILLPINKWNEPYQRVSIGGLSCDIDDYYSAELHKSNLYLPQLTKKEEPLHLGFFHTGAYQHALSGYGGIKHCLIPAPKQIILEEDETGNIYATLFAKEQTAKSMLKVLGYTKKHKLLLQ